MIQEKKNGDSGLRKGSDGSVVTAKEAEKLGIGWRYEPPKDGICAYCGKLVEAQGIVFGGEVFVWRADMRCGCEKAKRYWSEYDKAQEAAEAERKAQERRDEVKRRTERILGSSGIKKRFRMRRFETFRTDTRERKKAYKAAKEYADNFRRHRADGDGLYIEGTNGTGKTHLAAAIALQLIDEGTPVICKTAGDLLLDIKKSFDCREVSEAEVLDAYKKVDLLIIDDLGKEQCSDWSVSTLYSILNDRYEEMRPVIITTNYNTENLARALTPKGGDELKIRAIISRIKETSRVLTMAWKDERTGV